MNEVSLDEVIQQDPPSSGGRRSVRRAGREERDRERRQRRIRTAIAVLISLAILVGGAFAAVRIVQPIVSDLLAGGEEEVTDYPGPGLGSVEVVVGEGDTGSAIARTLHQAGVVATPQAFVQAFAANPAAQGIQPGTYRLMLEMRAADAVNALLDTTNRVQTRVTIPEGLRVEQMLERLSSVTAVPLEEFQAAMTDTAATGLPAEAGGNYEGWLFPATYTFEPGTTPTQMIAAMVSQTVANLDQRGVAPADRQTVLTKASLVEREARTPEDRAMVARAIQNRLDIGMKLDIDASVAYGAGKPGTELTREDLQTDGPYNLYTRAGLPPTPIAAPSLVSLDAVLNPAEGPWLFWVTVNLETGETRFAETYDEHLQNVQLLREWQAQQ